VSQKLEDARKKYNEDKDRSVAMCLERIKLIEEYLDKTAHYCRDAKYYAATMKIRPEDRTQLWELNRELINIINRTKEYNELIDLLRYSYTDMHKFDTAEEIFKIIEEVKADEDKILIKD